MSHRHRAIKPAYLWGAMSNTEPPEDGDDVDGFYGAPGVTPGEVDEHASHLGADSYHCDVDGMGAQ